MKKLKRFLKRFEDHMVAVTYAEEGEFETAKEIIKTSLSDKEEKEAVITASLKPLGHKR
jgi:hypothetical protein